MYFSVEIEGNQETLSSKEDVIKSLEDLVVMLKNNPMLDPINMGHVLDKSGNVVGVWLLK